MRVPGTVIFDLDGTLADIKHRRHWLDPEQHKDMTEEERWRNFFADCTKDKANLPLITMLIALEVFHRIVIFSGRSDEVRSQTMAWLRDHGIRPNQLRMRRAGDRTPDEVLKEQWLAEMDKDDIACVFDDRPSVIRMWRKHGLFVFDCGDGKEF